MIHTATITHKASGEQYRMFCSLDDTRYYKKQGIWSNESLKKMELHYMVSK